MNVFNDTVAPLVSINLANTPTSATAQTIAGEVSDNGTLANVTVQVGSATRSRHRSPAAPGASR